MRAYIIFNQKHPEIAEKYFNIHFNEQTYVREVAKKREEKRRKIARNLEDGEWE